MSDENVFRWDTDVLYQEAMANLPEWSKKSGSSISGYILPEIVPKWVRGDYQVGQHFKPEDCFSSASLRLYVRVRYPRGGSSKWMHYISLLPRDFYLIPEIVEYLLSGNIERVYESFVKERDWKNRR